MRKPNVKVTIHLRTDSLPAGADCRDCGHVSVQVGQNPTRMIIGGNVMPFHDPKFIAAAMMDSLHRAGIVCVSPKRKKGKSNETA